MEIHFRDVALVVQSILTLVIGIFMKYFHSELKNRDIKIDHLDHRLGEVELNYNDKFKIVYKKQDAMMDTLGDIKVSLGEVKTMVKDQKEFCTFIQESKRK